MTNAGNSVRLNPCMEEDTKPHKKGPVRPIELQPDDGGVLEITEPFDPRSIQFTPPPDTQTRNKGRPAQQEKHPRPPVNTEPPKEIQRTEFSSYTAEDLRMVLENAENIGGEELTRCIAIARIELQHLQHRLKEENEPIAQREARINRIEQTLAQIRHEIRITVAKLLREYTSSQAVNETLQTYHDFIKQWNESTSIGRVFRPGLIKKWLTFSKLRDLLRIETIRQVTVRSVKENVTAHSIMYNQQPDDIDCIFANSSEGMKLQHELTVLKNTIEKLAGFSRGLLEKIEILRAFLAKYEKKE